MKDLLWKYIKHVEEREGSDFLSLRHSEFLTDAEMQQLSELASGSQPTASAAGERELHAAAKEFHDLTVGDKAVAIRPDSQEKSDAIVASANRLRAALATKPQAEQEATPPAQAVTHVPEIGLTMFTGHNRAFHETFTIHVDPDMPSDEVQFRQGEQVLCRLILDGSARASNSGGAA